MVAGTGHLVFEGRSQKGWSISGKIRAVTSWNSITDKCLFQDVDASGHYSGLRNFVKPLLSKTSGLFLCRVHVDQ